ncbi:MAG: sensor histidine kinase, partial [Bacteroidales bacterium]
PLRYIPLSDRNRIIVFINFLALGILVVVVWMSSGYLIMRQLFRGDEALISSLVASVPYRVISGTLLYIMMLLVYFLAVYSRNLKERIQNEAKARTMVKEAELNMLRSQINPHFLFNSLNSVSALTLSNPKAAREMIVKLSEFLRYSLKLAEKEFNLLKDENENIRRYLDIEKVRFGNKMNFEIDCPDDCENYLVPNMILQPLFENALKHGVYESTDPIDIKMRCSVEDDMLAVSITNNYDSDNTPRPGAGIGMKNIRERLRLIYGREDLMLSRKEDGMFIVNLFIPYHEDKYVDS